ncbi:hypothetical protein [Halostella salina]|uniref:hypothetical protein n=1 Tax=Halostella salina TaxID=1547897 RepID=UPI0013CE7523|nr:hypothetical protein [Halostella salina]
MRRFFSALLLVTAVALAMGMGGWAAVEPVAAQENQSANQTTAAPPSTANGTLALSDAARITHWEFEDETVHVTVELEISRTVTISDSVVGLNSSGASRPPSQSWSLSRGTHNLTMPVERVRGGMAVEVETAGGSYVLRHAMDPPEDGANPFETFGGESGLFWGVGMTVIVAALAAWYTVRTEASGVVEA